MSSEEVRRKLEEIKAMYGGPPPQEIIDVTPEDLESDPDPEPEPAGEMVVEDDVPLPPTIVEQFRDAEKARIKSLSESEAEPAEGSDNAAGKSSGAGVAGLPPRDPERRFRDGGAESREPRPKSKAESAPDSV